MRVLLVGPEREENLSLRYLSSALLAAGHEPEIAPFDSLDDLTRVLERAQGFDVVGLSLCFQARAREFLTLATALKLHAPRTKIIAGGHYATCAAQELLAHHPDLDVIVLHEAERTLVELAATRFDDSRWGTIAGLAYRDGEQVVRTAPRRIETDLDALPFPDRRGRVRRLAGVPTAYLMGSRGCFSSCDYCCIVALHRTARGPRFRQRSVDNVADEMAELYHERGIRQFVFHDDNFLVPSVPRNHARLDGLAAAWQKRGLSDLGLVIKCRPGDVEQSVLAKLKQMGLLRVFLGVESASAAGLCSIGRKQEVAESERALQLCRRLGISAQYTLMCFHPDATVQTLRADLEFFRRHGTHAINFCRAETYAGTPLEERMRASGRGKGNYLARTYAIADPVTDTASRLAIRIFRERCWDNDSLMESAIGLNHLAAVVRHFRPSPRVEPVCTAVVDWHVRVNQELVELLSELVDICVETQGLDDPELRRRTRALVRRERESRPRLVARAQELRRRLRAVATESASASETRQEPTHRRRRVLQTVAAAYLAASVIGCGGDTDSDGGVSEYAPPPMRDSDGDGLPDECEESIFDTDPSRADSDGDGVDDGDENHDYDSLTNAEEQAQAGDSCRDVPDIAVSEYAPPPLEDTDGDGLPDECEDTIFGTDPDRVDTDGDGTPDGDENHDFGYMTNAEEQAQAGDYSCQDVDDIAVSEYAPPPMRDSDGDGLPDECEETIFNTDPNSRDTDGDGTPDGDENHDGGWMTNADEQAQAGDYGCQDIYDQEVDEYAPPPLIDTDGDGLPDQCEVEIFGTDPNLRDTDGDGTPDGDENHDFGMLTNAQEQAQAGDSCQDIFDIGVSEYAPTPLPDTDGDGLPDDCEVTIFGTDPGLVDTDGDGTPDGDEHHDLGTMTNIEEQRYAGEWNCQDVDDQPVSEMAAAPLPDADADRAAERWARAIIDQERDDDDPERNA